ncbi:MAG TPA: cellulase family glycosylhydrolase, partial [Acidimicrobiales bacterium]|nr:cellulase family glycosylhydrolase [Acidimicrobiales bacterium]
MSVRRKVALVVGSLLAVAATGTACVPSGGGMGPGHGDDVDARQGPVAPLSSEGRWLTDATGRVVTLHGVNEVEKSAPFYPAAAGFDADDARFLADQGFTVVRLGVVVEGLMPEPGRIDPAYIEALAGTVRELARRHVFVLLDFHQDGFSPKYNGNGLPDWMAIDDGLPNPPDAVFPLYYVQNPAMQRAFESFWANRPGPDGVGIQDNYVAGLTAVARRFARNPYVVGYELMNEPWPGATWEPCVTDPAR